MAKKARSVISRVVEQVKDTASSVVPSLGTTSTDTSTSGTSTNRGGGYGGGSTSGSGGGYGGSEL